MQYGISCRDILIIWCIEMKRDRNLMGSLLRVSERDLFFFRKEVIIISRNIVDNDTIYGWIIYIYIWVDWKIQASYEEDTRMPIAWYLFIDENGSSFATISDMTPVKKKKKKNSDNHERT